MKQIEIVSVNISEKKGTVKQAVKEIELDERGVKNDAHAGLWHRQVSMLAKESIEEAEKSAGMDFPDGTFAENITTRGLALHKTNILDRFGNENIAFEVTQIGKKCHAKCAIGRKVGNCIMPIEGIFVRVVEKGRLRPGDTLNYTRRIFKLKVITLSDRASSGEYEDKSGPEVSKYCKEWAQEKNIDLETSFSIIPDEKDRFLKELDNAITENVDIVISTGSTGIGERDIAPEVFSGFLEKEVPGIMEMIRTRFGAEKPNALLSRSVCGTKGTTLFFALPGSPKAVREYMEEIQKVLFHMILMVHGIGDH